MERIDILLAAWTGFVCERCRGRDSMPLAEVVGLVDALLHGCEPFLAPADDLTRVRHTAVFLLDAWAANGGSHERPTDTLH